MRVIFLYICIVIGLVFRSVPVGTTATVPVFRIMYVEDRAETECYPARSKGEVSYKYRVELKDWVHYFSMYVVVIGLSALLFSEGKKYFKILRQAGSSPSATISAYAFVDKETGDLFMAAGWNAPARHKRGNVLDASGLDACEEYGVRRLK